MQDINIDTNEKKEEEKFNLNEDIKAKKGLTLVMNMIIQLFLLSSAKLNSYYTGPSISSSRTHCVRKQIQTKICSKRKKIINASCNIIQHHQLQRLRMIDIPPYYYSLC